MSVLLNHNQPSRCETCPGNWPVQPGSYGVRTRSNPGAEATPTNVSPVAGAQAPVTVQLVGASNPAARNVSEPRKVSLSSADGHCWKSRLKSCRAPMRRAKADTTVGLIGCVKTVGLSAY